MPAVDLVYDDGCPNVAVARARLERAFAQAGMPARWREWWANDANAPAHVRGYGSPTVLVDGRDVAGAEPSPGMQSCRVYGQTDGSPGAPAVEKIVAALLRGDVQHREADKPVGWKGALAAAPAIGIALLPQVACPACWPAYAGALSSLGLGFLLKSRVLLPLTAVTLAVSVAALAFQPRRRRGFGPFALGTLAALGVLVGKFAFDADWAMYGSLVALLAASLWNSWPAGRRSDTCRAALSK